MSMRFHSSGDKNSIFCIATYFFRWKTTNRKEKKFEQNGKRWWTMEIEKGISGSGVNKKNRMVVFMFFFLVLIGQTGVKSSVILKIAFYPIYDFFLLNKIPYKWKQSISGGMCKYSISQLKCRISLRKGQTFTSKRSSQIL